MDKPISPSTRLVTEGAKPLELKQEIKDGIADSTYIMIGMGASFIGFVGGLLMNDLAVCVILLPLVIYFAYKI